MVSIVRMHDGDCNQKNTSQSTSSICLDMCCMLPLTSQRKCRHRAGRVCSEGQQPADPLSSEKVPHNHTLDILSIASYAVLVFEGVKMEALRRIGLHPGFRTTQRIQRLSECLQQTFQEIFVVISRQEGQQVCLRVQKDFSTQIYMQLNSRQAASQKMA